MIMNRTEHGGVGALTRHLGWSGPVTLSYPQYQKQRGIISRTIPVGASFLSHEHTLAHSQGTARPISASSLHDPVLRKGQDLIPYLSCSMELQMIEGSGLGWTAQKNVQKGELLMICSPLTIFHEDQPMQQPTGVQLFDHLIKTASELREIDLHWLDVLRGPGVIDDDAPASEGSEDGEMREIGDTNKKELPAAVDVIGADASNLKTGLVPDEQTEEDGRGSVGNEGGSERADEKFTEMRGEVVGQLQIADKERLMTVNSLIELGLGKEGLSITSIGKKQPPSLPQGYKLAMKLGANSYGHHSQDPGMRVLRDVPEDKYLGGHVGLFPWFCFFNHSCSPNACYMVIEDAMVVRAGCYIEAGDQVSVTYIGPRVVEPMSQRREYLKDAYSFKCTCKRCTFEETLPRTLVEFIDMANTACNMAMQLTEIALEKKDMEGLRETEEMAFSYRQTLHDVASKLERHITHEGVTRYRLPMNIKLELNQGGAAGKQSLMIGEQNLQADGSSGEISEPGVTVQELCWLEASVWRLQALQLEVFGGNLDPEALSEAVQVAETVAPGSDLHLSLVHNQLVAAVRLLQASQAQRGSVRGLSRHVSQSAVEDVREAVEACGQAYTSRYGHISEDDLCTLLNANMKQKWSQEEIEACTQYCC